MQDRRPLRDQPWDKTADAAAADNFFDIAKQAFPAFDRPLRRPEIGFVEDQLQRLFIGFVKSLAKCGHKPPARGAAAQCRKIDNRDERLGGDEMSEGGTHFGGDRHIGVFAAKDDDGKAGCGAVSAGAQAPPDAEGIDNRDSRAAIEQSLDKSLGGVGFARARGANDGDPAVEGIKR